MEKPDKEMLEEWKKYYAEAGEILTDIFFDASCTLPQHFKMLKVSLAGKLKERDNKKERE